MTPWPCTTCGAPGVRNVGTDGHCAEHLAALVAKFDAAHFGPIGYGLPHVTDLGTECVRCVRCEATWDGHVFQSCHYCSVDLESMRRHQADMVLEAPDVDPDDITYQSRMSAWAKRLRNAVDAELITEQDAVRAMDRASRKAAA